MPKHLEPQMDALSQLETNVQSQAIFIPGIFSKLN